MPTEEKIELPQSLLDFINLWRDKPGNLIMILHKTQEHFGFIPRGAAIELAKNLEVPLAKVYGVITFYHFFKLVKPGKNIISVCMGTACYIKGAGDLMAECETLLGCGVNCTTDDEEFSLQAVRCVGCCGLAPLVTVGDEVFGKISADDLPEIIAKYRSK
ncbi:MAG: NAD(P)H-dependent oxidoreductase subunit E [Spirochaetaceae bacterium]